MRGTMLWFNEVKDLGSILTEEGERLAVHGTAFAEGERPVGRCAGAAVIFEVSPAAGDQGAESVRFETSVAPRRARARHRSYHSRS